MDLKEFIAPALKWWWLIALATIVAGASSYLAARQQPQLYRSTATLAVGSAISDLNPTSGDFYLTQQLAGFYVNMSYRASLREDVMNALELGSLPEISVWNNNNLIEIIVTDSNPQRAQAVAAELSRQLVLRSPASQQRDLERLEFIERQLQNYETAIIEAQGEIEIRQTQLTTLVSAREIASAQNEIASLQSSLEQLEGNYARLISGTQRGATNSINVIEPATTPAPIRNSNRNTILAAAMIGFVLAASAAYALEYLDDTIKTPVQVTKLTDLPVLSGIARTDITDGLAAIKTPRAPVSEAYRTLRTGIQFSSVDISSRVLLITSSIPGEGKSTTAANLAVVIAQAEKRALLIDSDLRRPTLHRLFDLPNQRGLTNILVEFDLDQNEEETQELAHGAIQNTLINGLDLLSSGPLPPNPSELLGSAKMRTLLSILAHEYDYIILDSPPILSVTDAIVLSVQADSALLVVRANKTQRGQLRQGVAALRDVNARLIGAVLNALPLHGEGYRAYYHYQNSYYQEDEADHDGKKSDSTAKIGPAGKLRHWVAKG